MVVKGIILKEKNESINLNKTVFRLELWVGLEQGSPHLPWESSGS